MRAPRTWVWGLVLAGAAGCGTRPSPVTDTGSGESVRAYFEAVVRRDWPAAHAALHPGTRARLGPERFARLAEEYWKGLGFEPSGVTVRSCEEQGDRAVAHVVLT